MGPSTLATPPRFPDVPAGGDSSPGGGGGAAFAVRPEASPASIVVWLLVTSVTILFASFTSTYLARRGEADWSVGPVPGALYISTGVLILSSLVLEWARRAGSQGRLNALRLGLLAATILGIGFLGAQVAAWRQLAALGIFLASNPHSSFFYLLTGAHTLHIGGGLLGLGIALAHARTASTAAAALRSIGPAATFWHFLDGLWVYLLLILFVL